MGDEIINGSYGTRCTVLTRLVPESCNIYYYSANFSHQDQRSQGKNCHTCVRILLPPPMASPSRIDRFFEMLSSSRASDGAAKVLRQPALCILLQSALFLPWDASLWHFFLLPRCRCLRIRASRVSHHETQFHYAVVCLYLSQISSRKKKCTHCITIKVLLVCIFVNSCHDNEIPSSSSPCLALRFAAIPSAHESALQPTKRIIRPGDRHVPKPPSYAVCTWCVLFSPGQLAQLSTQLPQVRTYPRP